jgi:hypothetical protein
MIQNEHIFREWENKWVGKDRLTLKQKFRILDGMYEEAKALAIFPLKDPLEGLDMKIQFVKALHVRRTA